MSKPVLLFLEDEAEPQEEMIKAARKIGYDVHLAEDVDSALRCCRDHPNVAVAIVDLRIRPENDFAAGWDFLEQAKLSLETQVIIFTGHPDKVTVEALRRSPPKVLGNGYLLLQKNADERRLLNVLKDQFARQSAKLSDGIILKSQEDLRRKADLPMIAASGLPVLITGPSGCGKEHVAQEIAHLALPPSQYHRIQTVNCATLTENFAIATLFGYAPGAYTGGNPKGDAGILMRISGTMDSTARAQDLMKDLPGILILDEVAELSTYVQAQLLRMMQRQSINALGDSGGGYTPVIRVIACTNDEAKLSSSEKFREDLLGRLDGWHITIGSPYERKDTFIEAALAEARKFRMSLTFGEPPAKIAGVADDVPGEVAAKLVPGGLRFGFRELKGWIGRACAIALHRAGNDAQLTVSDLRSAWDRRMRLDDGGKRPSGKDELTPVPRDSKVAEVRLLFEKAMYSEAPAKNAWDEQDLQIIARRLKTENAEAYSNLVALKKHFTNSDARQKLLYLAINGTDANATEVRKFVDRLRKFLGATKS